MNILNLKILFEYVCYDCIDIILDYIDIPHDILKIIYYNKIHLYRLDNNDNKINETIDPIQLLLYKKFYEKVIKNLADFVGSFDVEWGNVSKLLDKSTILAGGSVLQSIYGNISESTEIPLDFYYKEYLDMYRDIDYYGLGYFIEKYKTKKTTTVCTDIDIFKVTNIDIFNTNEIVEYDAVQCADLGICELYRTQCDNYMFIIHIHHDNSDDSAIFHDKNRKTRYIDEYIKKMNNKIAGIIDSEKCDMYVRVQNLDEDDQSWTKNENNRNNAISGKRINDNMHSTTKNYIILNKKLVSGENLTKKNILNLIQNKKDSIKIVDTLPEIITCYRSFINDGGNAIEEYLLENNDTLMKNIHENESFGIGHKLKKYEFRLKSHLAYDNFEVRDGLKKWMEPMYDAFRIGNGSNVHEECYNVMFNSSQKKKIIPIAHPVRNGLMLNLIYINSSMFAKTEDYIENFDINICRQCFDGKKIILHSVADLVHKRFKYNIDKITDIENDDNVEKYICFKKRVEKYKARGFIFLDEIGVTNKVKNLLEINNIRKNIEKFRKMCHIDKNWEKYYENIIEHCKKQNYGDTK